MSSERTSLQYLPHTVVRRSLTWVEENAERPFESSVLLDACMYKCTATWDAEEARHVILVERHNTVDPRKSVRRGMLYIYPDGRYYWSSYVPKEGESHG